MPLQAKTHLVMLKPRQLSQLTFSYLAGASVGQLWSRTRETTGEGAGKRRRYGRSSESRGKAERERLRKRERDRERERASKHER